MSTSVETSPVFLGLALKLESDELYKLERQYLPLGKVGGFPAWLNPVCRSPMAFLLQIYCTSPLDPPHAFHRVLYLFACRKGCSNLNDSSNFAVFRCQLPRENFFYSPDGPTPLPSSSSLSLDPFFNYETFAKLCVVCGCRAAKRCSKCSKRMYCSRNHQIIDWQTCHREECGINEKDLTFIQKSKLKERQGFTFKEYGIEMIFEEEINENSDDESTDEEEEENNMEENKNEKTKKGELENLIIEKVNEQIENKIEEELEDVSFRRFNRIICLNPKQILRYQRGGNYLLATDFSSSPNLIPNCQLCGGPRQFEFQLMPYLLTLIDIDLIEGKSLDWATILIFTCKNNCQTNEYTREFIFKQDFVVKGNEEEINF